MSGKKDPKKQRPCNEPQGTPEALDRFVGKLLKFPKILWGREELIQCTPQMRIGVRVKGISTFKNTRMGRIQAVLVSSIFKNISRAFQIIKIEFMGRPGARHSASLFFFAPEQWAH